MKHWKKIVIGIGLLFLAIQLITVILVQTKGIWAGV